MVQTSKTKHKYKTGAIRVTVGRVGGESGRVGEGGDGARGGERARRWLWLWVGEVVSL